MSDHFINPVDGQPKEDEGNVTQLLPPPQSVEEKHRRPSFRLSLVSGERIKFVEYPDKRSSQNAALSQEDKINRARPKSMDKSNLTRRKSVNQEIIDYLHKHKDTDDDKDLTDVKHRDGYDVEKHAGEHGQSFTSIFSIAEWAQREKELEDEDRISRITIGSTGSTKSKQNVSSKFSDFTNYNRHFLKWAVVCIGVWNFMTGTFICWQYVMNHALQEYLLSINSINCLPDDNEDWLPIWTNIICCFASVSLLFADNEESAAFCIFWAVVKLFTCVLFLYIRVMRIMIVPYTDWALEIAWVVATTLIDMLCLAIVILQYYRLTNNKPVRQRLNNARGNSYLNREIWFAGEQEFFRSKHAYRWVCRDQSLKIVEKIDKLRHHYKRPNKTYKFSAEDYDVDYKEGYKKYRKSYNILTDIFNGVDRLDFGRYADDEDLLRDVETVDDLKTEPVLTPGMAAYLYSY